MLPLLFLDTIPDFPPSLIAPGINKPSWPEELEAVGLHPKGRQLLDYIARYSPFLTRTALQFPDALLALAGRGPDAVLSEIMATLAASPATSVEALMRIMRIAKSKVSLIVALADITRAWGLEQVTHAMSDIAELCVRLTLRFLLQQQSMKNRIALKYPDEPERESGIFILALGKLGGYELNYSSDIDLVVFFDRTDPSTEIHELQQQFARLTRELVRMLQERTQEGYVFRVDLRLRPDPSSTPVAMSTSGALTYYETVGQNWERAAFIKARFIAGDADSAAHFLQQLKPFIWRKHLDFAAIADIQSIKRQMDAQANVTIDLPGHNIKTGLGGIREIEFFAQIHQLIWGGRLISIRTAATCMTLQALADAKLITHELTQSLISSYRFLREVEHRLQMVDDQQTHSLPTTSEAMEKLAGFMGYEHSSLFSEQLLAHLHFVHENFASSFRGQGRLGAELGHLSFTGVENDPQTLKTLSKMGYANPAAISEIIQAWHHGARRVTRNRRARELITELTPVILEAFAKAYYPDQAFIRFDDFLDKLPASVQLFSLFNANPHLLELIAVIIGSAPAMAESLSKNPSLLDTLLASDFFASLPDLTFLQEELGGNLRYAIHFEDEMDRVRRFRNEKYFQAGVQLILGQIDAMQASGYLSDIAEACIRQIVDCVSKEFSKTHLLPQGELAIIALGRLGSRKLTFGSDIDLIFVYHSAAPQSVHELYNKLSRRIISALTVLTREGRLYEVDTRLRPSGKDGALAVSLSAFEKYLEEAAWTFESMALTRARVITTDASVRARLHKVIKDHLAQPRDPVLLAKEILELRAKVEKEFGTRNPWNIKYAVGGLMELDFLAQYWVLRYARSFPQLIFTSTRNIFSTLLARNILTTQMAGELTQAHIFLNTLFALLRLCGGDIWHEPSAPQGLKHLLAAQMKLENFEAVKAELLKTLAIVHGYFDSVLHTSQISQDTV